VPKWQETALREEGIRPRSQPARFAYGTLVSKATGIPGKIAARLMTGRKLREFLPEYVDARADLDTEATTT